MAPPVDVVGPCPGLGDVEAPPRLRSSLSSEAEVKSEPLGRARRRPSAEARAESEPWGRAKRSSSSSRTEPESEPWGRAKRSSSSSGAEPESEPWVGRSGVSHCDTPGVNFALCWEIYPNLGCSVKISISRSRMSLIIQIIYSHFTKFGIIQSQEQPNLELLKLLFSARM
jgi:hypothetical protein